MTTFYNTTYISKHFQFPSTISEWNTLNFKIWQSRTLRAIRNALLKVGQTILQPIYNVYNLFVLKLLTRMRLFLSNPNQQKFNYNFQNFINSLHSCILETEFISHFFLHVHDFTNIRSTLQNQLQSNQDSIVMT